MKNVSSLRKSSRVKKTREILEAGPLRKQRGTGKRIVKRKPQRKPKKKTLKRSQGHQDVTSASIRVIARERTKKLNVKLESKSKQVGTKLIC